MPAFPDPLAQPTIEMVRRWLGESADVAPDPSARRLAGLLKDPKGLDFTIGFVDGVVRPEDLRVAGRNLELLSRSVPSFLPAYLRVLIQLAGGFAPLLPWPIVPIARAVLRRMVGHLILDAGQKSLDKSIARLRQSGTRLNLNLLGEAVLGDEEADRRLAGTRELLERDDVDYVSIKVSSTTSQLSPWAFEQTVDRVVARLTPLYERAAASPGRKFINLDMEEYRDLALTVAVFTRLLEQPKLRDLEAGIVLQAYLPDALAALQSLTAWADARRMSGGAGIKVRVVKGANLPMERVDAALHGWPLATWGSKRETDANYKRMLDWAFTPERTAVVRIGVAGHNLFDIAHAWLLAKERGVEARIEVEMLLGMATGQADAVKREVGGLLLYTPVVEARDFHSAISYLIRRLDENSSTENFMSGVFELDDPEIFAREERRFLDSLADAVADPGVPEPHRVQDRSVPAPPSPVATSATPFENEPDTDPATEANRRWAGELLSRVAESRLGVEAISSARVGDADALEAIVTATALAGEQWGQRRADTRAAVLHAVADVLSGSRATLLEVMASETGKTIAEGDPEVSEAIDFARYYAEQARQLDQVENAQFLPSRLIVVTPPWNFPLAIPAGSVLAALASGAAVILKPAPQARRTAAVLAEAFWLGGVPRDVLRLVDLDEDDLGRVLVAHPEVDRVILTGSWETAELFRSWRSDLPLLAETSGKNAIVVTPSADFDLAVSDIMKSAFGHAGQKCSAASLVILVGSVGASERFIRQLVDAVKTMRVGYPHDPASVMGPIIEPAHGKLERALTHLDAGESWLVRPQPLDESGRLWSPGVKEGVAAGSEFHLTEYFGPVLGIMRADTLDDAIALQNAPAYGLTAGIHSLDPVEVDHWLDRVEAGNLYVNRGITGAIVRRQPFGGWKRSAVGAGAKAGGPNYLIALGEWAPVYAEPGRSVVLRGASEPVTRLVEAAEPGMEFLEFDRVRSGVLSDERAWSAEFGLATDVSDLRVEQNLFRYRPVPVTVRLSDGAGPSQLVRVLAAATRAGAPVTVSTPVPLPARLIQLFRSEFSPLVVRDVLVETDERWLARVQARKPGEFGRIRLLGGDAAALSAVIGQDLDVTVYAGPVTTSGRLELLPFLREQSISVTAHRFGNLRASGAAVA
jgi:RHH-type proline utilization regulon transcriptional repressor/proline dehydrogenase/delta 1-pyrroline-5-carboxylate dehydrogenase